MVFAAAMSVAVAAPALHVLQVQSLNSATVESVGSRGVVGVDVRATRVEPFVELMITIQVDGALCDRRPCGPYNLRASSMQHIIVEGKPLSIHGRVVRHAMHASTIADLRLRIPATQSKALSVTFQLEPAPSSVLEASAVQQPRLHRVGPIRRIPRRTR